MKLTVEGVCIAYQNGALPVLDTVMLEIAAGQRVCLVGPSGCGKTSLLLCMAGLRAPQSGQVYIDDVPLTAPHPSIATVLQDYGLFPWKTVYDNIALPLRLRGQRAVDAQVQALLGQLGLSDRARHFAAHLSGGERQRVAIARALITRPSLLLLDEPFAALDLIIREQLEDTLLTACTERACSLLLVTHDLDQAVYVGQRLFCYDKQGRTFVPLDNPAVGCDRVSEVFLYTRARLHRVLSGGSV